MCYNNIKGAFLNFIATLTITLITFFSINQTHALAAKTSHTGLDPASAEALQKTQELLRSKKQRDEIIKEDERAAWVHKQVESIGGSPENTEAIYKLSADILAEIAKEAQGDPAKMNEILKKLKNDPISLEKKLSPKEREKLRDLSHQIPNKNSPTPPPSVLH